MLKLEVIKKDAQVLGIQGDAVVRIGTLFYRFISENFALYIEADDDSINYAELPDRVITPEIKDDAIKTKGYYIYPSQLFANVAKSANSNESLNTDLAAIFAAIENSASPAVEAKDTREVVDIGELNAELKTTVAKIDQLRQEIDAIVAEIERAELNEKATVNHQLTVQKVGEEL